MKQINTPEEVQKALPTPLPQENKELKSPLKTKKKYNYTKKTGKPRAEIKDVLPENWKEIIIQMSMEGCSDVEIRAHLCCKKKRFSHELWYALKEREADFAETLQIGKVLCQAWWEKQGRLIEHMMHTKGQVFETGLWYSNMKNRFGWRDKTEIDHGISDDTFEKYRSLGWKDLQARLIELGPVNALPAGK